MQTPPPEYAQYPRPQGLPSGVQARPPGVYFDALNDAWAMFARAWTTWVAAQLAIGLISIAIFIPFLFLQHLALYGSAGILPPPGAEVTANGKILSWLIGLLPAFLIAGLQAGFFTMAIRQVRGQEISFGDAFGSVRFAPKIFLITTCIGLPGMFCYIVFGLPGMVLQFLSLLILYPVFCLSAYIAVDQPVSAFQAMAMSARELIGFMGWITMLLLFIVFGLIYIAGFLACVVGMLASGPLVYLTVAAHYYFYFPDQFQTLEQAPYPQP